MTYIPSQLHSSTSVAAGESVKPDIGRLQAMVLRYIRAKGGATDEEIGIALGLPGNTARPRRRELQIMKLIEDSGETRKTASGRAAVVWRVKP